MTKRIIRYFKVRYFRFVDCLEFNSSFMSIYTCLNIYHKANIKFYHMENNFVITLIFLGLKIKIFFLFDC